MGLTIPLSFGEITFRSSNVLLKFVNNVLSGGVELIDSKR